MRWMVNKATTSYHTPPYDSSYEYRVCPPPPSPWPATASSFVSHPGVPHCVESPSGPTGRAKPKSASLRVASSSSLTRSRFSGFKSRWATPRSWQYLIALNNTNRTSLGIQGGRGGFTIFRGDGRGKGMRLKIGRGVRQFLFANVLS